LIEGGGRGTRILMLRASTILALTLALLFTAAGARAAEETPSSSEESAPFAGGAAKGPAPFAGSPSAGFAAVGQWVPSMRTTGDSGYVFFHRPSGGDWELSLHPAIDYFIVSSVSLGATFGYTYSPAATGTTTIDLGGRAGYNLNINDNVGVWPMAGFNLRFHSSNHNHDTGTSIGIFAPFLYHLVPHLFAGLGPSFAVQTSGGSGNTFGIDFILGGWL